MITNLIDSPLGKLILLFRVSQWTSGQLLSFLMKLGFICSSVTITKQRANAYSPFTPCYINNYHDVIDLRIIL